MLRRRGAREPRETEGSALVRVLVVEDEPALATAIGDALKSTGHGADLVSDGLEAIDWTSIYPYDLVILDVNLPGLDGFAVCARLREAGQQMPILMITARDSIDDRIEGLDRGADDYLAKPFAMGELLARVRALRRRQLADRIPVIRVADLEIDPAALAVRRGGTPVRLTAREFAVLEVLARHPGQIFSQDRLTDAVWGADFTAGSNLVEVYIRSIRRKLDEGRRDGLIETVRGAGYRLRAEEPGH